MNPSVDYVRDDVSIGSEWSYDFQLNGERASLSHTVTEQDIANGFEKRMGVYVTENGGRNRGKSAHFAVTYTFSPFH